MKEAISAKTVGHVMCSCCPMKVHLLNDEGLKGSPSKDYLEVHQRHIPFEKDEQHCPSSRIQYHSRRRAGETFTEDPPHVSESHKMMWLHSD